MHRDAGGLQPLAGGNVGGDHRVALQVEELGLLEIDFVVEAEGDDAATLAQAAEELRRQIGKAAGKLRVDQKVRLRAFQRCENAVLKTDAPFIEVGCAIVQHVEAAEEAAEELDVAAV